MQVRKLAPKHMHADQAGCAARHAHVTCATFSRQGEIVATYNDEVTHSCCFGIVREAVVCSSAVVHRLKLGLVHEQGTKKWPIGRTVDLVPEICSLQTSAEETVKQLACSFLHCCVACVEDSKYYHLRLLQKIYLFGAEGASQDRGRPRPASTAASSPAKRAKTSSQGDDAAHDQQTDEEEEEETDHQARRDPEDGRVEEKDSSSTSQYCAAQSCNPI